MSEKSKVIKEYKCDNEVEFANIPSKLFSDGLKWFASGDKIIKCPYDTFPVYVQEWNDKCMTYCSTPDQ